MSGVEKLDKIDEVIISVLQADARISIKALSKKTYLSGPAISARIKRLEEEKIISGYHAAVDPFQLGYLIKAFITLQLSPEKKPEFYPFIRSFLNVIECDCITGDYSMIIKVVFRSTMELEEFIGQLQKFGPTKTQIVFSTPVETRGVAAFKSTDQKTEAGKH